MRKFFVRLSAVTGALLLLLSPIVRISPLLTKVQAATPPVPSITYTVLAAGERSAITTVTSNNATTLNNGTEWYYSLSASMGFAPEGATINQTSADTNGTNQSDPTGPKRLSWHTSNSKMQSGWRAGLNTSLYNGWTRYIYQANTLPSYYPSGPQVNVSQENVTGWTLCYQGSYGDNDIALSSIFDSCSGQYLMYAAAQVEGQKMDVKQNDTSLLYEIGGSFNENNKVYPGSTVNLSLYESDGTTPVNWNTYRAYVSNCDYSSCWLDNPQNDSNPTSWDGGTVTSGAYTIPANSANKSIVFFPADDVTGERVPGNFIKINITKVPEIHLISDCDQLMNMDTDYGNGSEKDIYKLTKDIDCSTVENPEPLSWNNNFAGTLDGQGFTISNLALVDSNQDGYFGLISETNDATIKNISIKDSTVDGYYDVGAIVGYANQTTFSNVHSSADISGTDSYVGGLIGEAEESTITNSSATGDVTADKNGSDYVGGLVGGLWDSEVTYSYATGNVEGSYSVGGLIGEGSGSTVKYSIASGSVSSDVDGGSGTGGFIGRNSSDISESYATGNVEGHSRVGGFAGANGGYIENSFARGSVSGDNNVGGFAGRCGNEIYHAYSTGSVSGNSTTGGFLGNSTGCSVNGSYWDVETSGIEGSDAGDPKMTSEMKDINTFSEWDFDSVWVLDPATNDGYPSFIKLGEDGDLDNIPNVSEELAPNSGDADDDGIADQYQENVTSLPNGVDGQYVALKTDCGTGTANKEVNVSKEDTSKTDAAYTYQQGLVGFKTRCPAEGATATVTVFFYGVTSKDGLVLRKFNPTTGAYTNLTDATMTLETIGGRSVLKAVYEITDGGALDQDGVADGTITDPVGLASLVISVPNTGL